MTKIYVRQLLMNTLFPLTDWYDQIQCCVICANHLKLNVFTKQQYLHHVYALKNPVLWQFWLKRGQVATSGSL